MRDELKLPPHDSDAEQSLLGAMMVSRDAVDTALLALGVDDFYSHANRLIFREIVDLHEQGTSIDGVTLAKALNAAGSLEEIGGPVYLSELMEATPHAWHAESYARIIKEHSLRRRAISCAMQVAAAAYNLGASVEEAMAAAENEIHKLIERQVSAKHEETISDVLSDAFANIGQARQRGITTGFDLLDQWTFGWQPGQLVILAARPSVGKTAMACNFALAACRQGHTVAFFSLEQPKMQLAERMLSTQSAVDLNKIKSGDISESERYGILEASNRLGELPLYLDDGSDRTVSQVAARCRLLRRRHNLAFVVIDYLQLLRAEDSRVPRERQVAEMSRSCAIIARDLDIPVMILCQFNRASTARSGDDRAPRLSDLRESGSLEQDGRVILLIDRPYTYDPVNNEIGETVLHLAKNSEGETGKLKLTFKVAVGEFIEQSVFADAGGVIERDLFSDGFN